MNNNFQCELHNTENDRNNTPTNKQLDHKDGFLENATKMVHTKLELDFEDVQAKRIDEVEEILGRLGDTNVLEKKDEDILLEDGRIANAVTSLEEPEEDSYFRVLQRSMPPSPFINFLDEPDIDFLLDDNKMYGL